MMFDLNAVLGQLGRDKGIERQVLIDAVESAMLSAAKKHFGHNLNLEVAYNEESGEVEILQFRTVVERVEDDETQISLKEARAEFDPEAMVGDEFGRKLDTAALGRIAAQTAKQVILQKVRDAERDVIYEEYKGSKGDLVNGIVQRYDKGTLVVNLGRTEAALPKKEQISRERYNQGDRLRGMILDIDRSSRGPLIILTRSHPDFLRKLFALEVPEMQEGTVEIKAVAREPGERAKIAVHSKDGSIDPVGSFVGVKGSRVRAVVEELRGERIDIITWTPDEPSFVARALAPAEVVRVVVDEDEHSMEVIVADDQLSLAIGRRGQNVKLASKLTGWRIDVRSVSIAENEAKQARESIETIPGIEFTYAELLFQEGYRSAAEVAEAAVDELAEIEGISMEMAQKILEGARSVVSTKATAQGEVESGALAVTELDSLLSDPDLKRKLLHGGYNTIQSVVIASDDELRTVEDVTDGDIELIREATEAFTRAGRSARERLNLK